MFLQEIHLKNLLSFGPATPSLKLRPLNVLIGPNGSGKSNFIEAISLLRSAHRHLGDEVRDGGGILDWLWKGVRKPTATVEVVATNLPQPYRMPIRHSISFLESKTRFELVTELIEDSEKMPGHDDDVYFYYRNEGGRPIINVRAPEDAGDTAGQRSKVTRRLRREDIDPEKSILAQRKDPDQYPEITFLGDQYERVRIYREWSFGRYTGPRQPQKADLRNDYLEENCANLALIINKMKREPASKRRLIAALEELLPHVSDVDVTVEAGYMQILLHEGDFAIPATRLSDGTLRYLCLLAILFQPDPPPLVCIEEPELGLHPDVMAPLGKLLKEASEKMQLIVTTHSDELVDSLSDTPEDVIVCTKQDGCTRMDRLEPAELEAWLDEYHLGELWRRGDLGGNRW